MEPTRDLDHIVLPEGTRLVHIGPPKTATSSVQGSFHAARAATEAQGVHYAGRRRHSSTAVQAVTGRPGFYTEGQPASMDHWHRLLRDVTQSKASRVVVSSEFFADAQPETIPRIVSDLDGSRMHVVVTLRPLAKIVPSQWQQYVQSGMLASYEEFLERQFGESAGTWTPTFWRRHRHDQLVQRWADAVGPANVTVIVLDESDHEMVLRVFERLTGLRSGTLTLQPDVTNRSMTMPEIEAVRALNAALKADELGSSVQSRLVHFGTATFMRKRQPAPDEPRVETPQWALDRIAVVARDAVDAIGAMGVRIVGDLESLAVVSPSRLDGDRQPEVTVPPAIAATMAMGVLYATGVASERVVRGEPLDLFLVPTRDLSGVLIRRGRSWVYRRLPGRSMRAG